MDDGDVYRSRVQEFEEVMLHGVMRGGLQLAIAALMSMGAYAHHSLDQTYDLKTELKLEGKIVQVLVRNPHSFLHVEALDSAGVMQRWAFEKLSNLATTSWSPSTRLTGRPIAEAL